MRKHLSTLASLLLSSLMWPVAALSQGNDTSFNVATRVCQPGEVLNGIYADVIVNGGNCTLDGATVHGSVHGTSGGAITLNRTTVHGSLQVTSVGDITLRKATTVSGQVKLEQSGNLSVTESTVSAIFSKGSKGITLHYARVFPGGVTMESSTGALRICGSEIGINSDTGQEGSGDVKVIESVGNVVADAACGASEIAGTVSVVKGNGEVRLVGATLNDDLIVIEHHGKVTVVGRACAPDGDCAAVSDVKVEKSTGDIRLEAVTTASDMTIVENDGHVTIKSSSVGGDAAISRTRNNKSVMITGSSFALEDVLISGNTGPVVIDSNCDMRLTVVENTMNVAITNNNPVQAAEAGATCFAIGFTDADVSNNKNVTIEGNTGEGLYCSGNDPAPKEGPRGNLITFSDGQCAGF